MLLFISSFASRRAVVLYDPDVPAEDTLGLSSKSVDRLTLSAATLLSASSCKRSSSRILLMISSFSSSARRLSLSSAVSSCSSCLLS